MSTYHQDVDEESGFYSPRDFEFTLKPVAIDSLAHGFYAFVNRSPVSLMLPTGAEVTGIIDSMTRTDNGIMFHVVIGG